MKISVDDIDCEILDEIHKFPFPIQQIIVSEVCAVEKRIEHGKVAPGLISLECHCLFFRKYRLPCQYIFHEHMYGARKLLITSAWEDFQQMFEEHRFEIYKHHDLEEMVASDKTECERAAED